MRNALLDWRLFLLLFWPKFLYITPLKFYACLIKSRLELRYGAIDKNVNNIKLLHEVLKMKRDNTEFRVIQVKDKNIGIFIREIREEQKIRQTDIVKQLQLRGVDISIYSYNRIERGTQNPTVTCLLGLCDILKCDMNRIFGL